MGRESLRVVNEWSFEQDIEGLWAALRDCVPGLRGRELEKTEAGDRDER